MCHLSYLASYTEYNAEFLPVKLLYPAAGNRTVNVEIFTHNVAQWQSGNSRAASDFRHTAAGARKYRERTIKPTTIR